jgi:hypothetical protein
MTSQCLPLLLASALSLTAQDASVGMKVLGSLPMSDLRNFTDHRPGIGAALFIELPMGEALLLRPSLGAQQIPVGGSLGQGGTLGKVTSVDLMLDALWFPNADTHDGPYLVGSLGAQEWRVSSPGTTPASTDVVRLGAAGGLGYQFSPRLGVEVKAFWSSIETKLTATGLSLGATWKF